MKNVILSTGKIILLLVIISVLQSCTKAKDATLPSLETVTITGITQISAVSGGNITDDNGSAITVRGVCWGIAATPTTAGSHTMDGTGTGTYISNISGLTAGTLYYVRAYATNSIGTAYGNELTFTTTTGLLATLTTTVVSSITGTTAVSGGNITSGNGSDITARGVCYGIATNPTVDGFHTSDGTGTGSFTSSISGLTGNTLYFVRAYATNNTGTAYGNEVSFTTTTGTLASLTTTAVSSITTTTSVSGGNITNDNGSAITARGVCWGISTNPTISGSHTTNGTGTGTFTSNITGLTAGTEYFVRAYATNSAGTSYGNQVSFTTVSGSAANEVSIQNNAFNPGTITVPIGTTITWTNRDGLAHTVTSNTGIFDSGSISDGVTFSRQFNTAGTFPYHCTFHLQMTGTVVVN